MNEQNPDESRLLTEKERMAVGIPCEQKCNRAWPNFLSAECLDCAAIQHEKAQLAKDLEYEENWQADFTEKTATKYEKRVAEIEARYQAEKKELGSHAQV